MTLLIFILSFRSQNKAIQEQAYQKVLDDYSDIIRMQATTPELYRFQLELTNRLGQGREGAQYTREDMIIRNYVIMIYGFFERVYFLYRRKWIDQDTWKSWAAFLQLMATHPVFKEIHETSTEMWDRPFVEYVESLLRHTAAE